MAATWRIKSWFEQFLRLPNQFMGTRRVNCHQDLFIAHTLSSHEIIFPFLLSLDVTIIFDYLLYASFKMSPAECEI